MSAFITVTAGTEDLFLSLACIISKNLNHPYILENTVKSAD